MKYNYKKAGQLFDLMAFNIFDMGEIFDFETRQKERRLFMRKLTRGENIDIYLDMITDYIISFDRPENTQELEKLALSMVLFTN